MAGHINPDGDSIGSLLSLGLGIERMGKKVYMLSPDGVPRRYRALPSAGRIIAHTKKGADLAIAVDCSNRELLGRAWRDFERSKTILEIDHHDFRRSFGDLSFIDSKAAAVGELIYLLLQRWGVRITDEIAQNLLTSIIVETNSFRLPNVRPFTFKVCADLLTRKVDFYKLVDIVFWSVTRESAVLGGICMSRCRFLKGGRLAWSIIRKKDFDVTRGSDEDVDAVADQIRAIKDVKVAILFREKRSKLLRVSLRSKDKINVARLAEYCGGGGHFDVAGCTIPNKKSAMDNLLKKAKALFR